jgi:dual specificity MAP kinase phosphatase
MATFFGCSPPYDEPRYRGLCILKAPVHPLDKAVPPLTPEPETSHIMSTSITPPPKRERSETVSTSSESYHSSAPTEATSIDEKELDVQMHPLESKCVSPQAKAAGLDVEHHPLPCSPESSVSESSATSESGEEKPSCLLMNALHLHDVFRLPSTHTKSQEPVRPGFRDVKLPQQINLRNLNIQQIKYAMISDIIIYASR